MELQYFTRPLFSFISAIFIVRRLHCKLVIQLYHMDYTVPSGTRIGHVHLKVSDLDKALAFYKDLLGFKIMARYGTQAVFIAADGYHHHIGLNTWYSKNAKPAPVN